MPTKSIATLRRKADKLYQQVYIPQKPRSVVSGEPTQVLHHFIPKSQSANLRYDKDNGVPLTNKEHCRHHLSGDPTIIAKVLEVNGQEWFDNLSKKRHVICKMNKGYLRGVIENLETQFGL